MVGINETRMLHNAHYREAQRHRLGILTAPQGAMCQLPMDSTADVDVAVGGEQFEHGMLMHPLVCGHAASRHRPHITLCRAMGRLARAAGATADYERALPELYRWERDKPNPKEAIVDVVLTLRGALSLQTVDVCISRPHADRTAAAWRRPGVAATNAERRKATRYGNEVMPFSFGNYCRMGPRSRLAIKAMARCARTYGVAKVPPALLVQKWRADVELALYFVETDIILQSRGVHVEKAGPTSHPIRKILPGKARVGTSTNEVRERSSAPIDAD